MSHSHCSFPPTMTDNPEVQLSVHHYGEVEAQRHKWIESEKAGRDLGEWAIRSWVGVHWHKFLRARWLEHLYGRVYWIELDHNDYGVLLEKFQDSAILPEVLIMLKTGLENLNVLNWAIDNHLPMAEVLDILETLDINSRRIECLFASRLPPST
jgi:hypothetical protein